MQGHVSSNTGLDKITVVLSFEAVNAFLSHWRITKRSNWEPGPRGHLSTQFAVTHP